MGRAFRTLALLAAAALAAGCSIKDTPAPDLTAPSELALSLIMSATPDTIAQDGSSQALVVVIARDTAGRAVGGLPIRFDVALDGLLVDYGGLSVRTVTTGTDGRASTVYTAPAPPPNSADVGTTKVSVVATPIGTNYGNIVPRSVEIRLVPQGSVPAPGLGPVASFSYAWAGFEGVGEPVVFDASASSSLAGIASYAWDFGDGSTASGVTARHTYAAPGTYAVRLTVTDRRGQTAWTTRQILVAAGPTASFTWSVVAPRTLRFDASGSFTVPPATIVEYAWNFGDSTPLAYGMVPPLHTFAAAGSYAVKLTVTDSNGLVGRVTQTVTIQ